MALSVIHHVTWSNTNLLSLTANKKRTNNLHRVLSQKKQNAFSVLLEKTLFELVFNLNVDNRCTLKYDPI